MTAHLVFCSKSHFFANQLAKGSGCRLGKAGFRLECEKSYPPSAVAMRARSCIPRVQSCRAAAALSSARRVPRLCITQCSNFASGSSY